MIDSRNNSNLLYLPLDKLMQQAGGTAATATTTGAGAGRRATAAAAPPSGMTLDPRSRDGQARVTRRPLIDQGSIRT